MLRLLVCMFFSVSHILLLNMMFMFRQKKHVFCRQIRRISVFKPNFSSERFLFIFRFDDNHIDLLIPNDDKNAECELPHLLHIIVYPFQPCLCRVFFVSPLDRRKIYFSIAKTERANLRPIKLLIGFVRCFLNGFGCFFFVAFLL